MGRVKNTAYDCWELSQGVTDPDWDKIAKETGLPDGKTAELWASEWAKLEGDSSYEKDTTISDKWTERMHLDDLDD